MTLRVLSIVAALATALAFAHAPPSSAQQADGRGLGAVQIKAEDGREVKLYDKSFALVIGVSDYAVGWPKLPGVKKDIEEVARALELHGFQVTKVENPDSAQLDKAFKTFIDEHGLGVENRLLFYFAGHGHTIKQSYGEEMGYIVPVDAPSPNRNRAGFMSKAMDMQQIELYARRAQSKHALFVFDSCFSGALFALSRAIPDSISYKTARPVRQFITSGSADEQVPDQSVFRRQFVEALEGEADGNRDGYVTGAELGEFLQNRVVNYSRNAQHPQYGKIRNPNLDKGDFVFALPKALKPPPVAASTNPTPQPTRVDPSAVELAFWDAIKNSNDPEDYKEYLAKYPNGQFSGIARRRTQQAAAKNDSPLTNERPTENHPAAPLNPPTSFPVRVSVRADNTANGWTDSGVMLQRGQRLRVTATGRISLGKGYFSTSSGLPNASGLSKLMRDVPVGTMLAVIGTDNDNFIAVGSSREFTAERDGRLFFGVNEDKLDDNTGVYDALLEIEANSATATSIAGMLSPPNRSLPSYESFPGGFSDGVVDSALMRGYVTGYSDGYQAGHLDSVNQAQSAYWNKEYYLDADRGYAIIYGPRGIYRDGYQQGFEVGYKDGHKRRTFNFAPPAGRITLKGLVQR